VIAPFADLEIADVRLVSVVHADSRMSRDERWREPPPVSERRDELASIGCAEEQIDLRKHRLQLGAVALHHAAHGHDGATGAGLLVGARAHQRVDRFFLGRIEEAAGVDSVSTVFLSHPSVTTPTVTDGRLGTCATGDKLAAAADRLNTSRCHTSQLDTSQLDRSAVGLPQDHR
jgi:hypothetical protein